MADKINKIKLQGSDAEYELESTSVTCNNGGVRIDDDTEGSGLRDGSTVLFNKAKNVNLESGKNVLIKSKKGKLVCDTTETIKAGNGNELQIISKVKENIKTGTSLHRTESSSYCGDHGDILMEVRRLRIKPFNVPKWTSADSDNPSSTTAHSKEKYDGYIYLDTAGYEDVAAGGNPAESASSESTFEIRVGNNGTTNNGLTTGEYRPLTVKTRGIDLRCMTHGGIAVQPCGYDEPNNSKHHENKIKFESSRIQSIYADDIQEDETGMYINNTKSGYIYQSGTPLKDKWVKGGDGLEFGTFNNFHTSLFTRDYRFNENGIVYAVNREVEYEDANGNKYTKGEDGYYINGEKASPQPVIVKADYKTQLDDFKDKLSSDKSQSAKWKHIVKTAYVLNGAPGMKTDCSWNEDGTPKKMKIESTNFYTFIERTDSVSSVATLIKDIKLNKYYSKDDLKELFSADDYDNTIKTAIKLFVPIPVVTSGGIKYSLIINLARDFVLYDDHEINLEAGNDIKMTAADEVLIEANREIRLNAIGIPETSDSAAIPGIVNFGASSYIQFLTTKYKKSGKLESASIDPELLLGIYNNSKVTIYTKMGGGVRKFARELEILYTKADKSVLYQPSKHKLYDIDGNLTEIEQAEPGGFAIYDRNGELVLEDTTCFVKDGDSIYKCGTKGTSAVMSKSVKIVPGTWNEDVFSPDPSNKDSKDYADTTFIVSEVGVFASANGFNDVINPDGFLKTDSVKLSDVATLVNYFKTGAGKSLGPWAQ